MILTVHPFTHPSCARMFVVDNCRVTVKTANNNRCEILTRLQFDWIRDIRMENERKLTVRLSFAPFNLNRSYKRCFSMTCEREKKSTNNRTFHIERYIVLLKMQQSASYRTTFTHSSRFDSLVCSAFTNANNYW